MRIAIDPAGQCKPHAAPTGRAKAEGTNSHFFSPFLQQTTTFFAQEMTAKTEIQYNGLLEKVRRPASKSGVMAAAPGPPVDTFSPAPVMATSLLAGVGIGSNAGLLFFIF
jgi:hypothetical protein